MTGGEQRDGEHHGEDGRASHSDTEHPERTTNRPAHEVPPAGPPRCPWCGTISYSPGLTGRA